MKHKNERNKKLSSKKNGLSDTEVNTAAHKDTYHSVGQKMNVTLWLTL